MNHIQRIYRRIAVIAIAICIAGAALGFAGESRDSTIFVDRQGILSAEQDRPGLTKEERAWLQTHPDIRIATEARYAHLIFMDSEGIRRGISVDLVKLLEQRLKTDRSFSKRINDLYRSIVNSQKQS